MMTQIEDDMNHDMVKKFTYNKKNSKTDHNSNLAVLDATSIEKKYQFYEEYLEKILRMEPLTKKQKAEIIEDMKKSRSRFQFLKEETEHFPRVTHRVSVRISHQYQYYYSLEIARRWLAYNDEEPTEILIECYHMPLIDASISDTKGVRVIQEIFHFFGKCHATLNITPWNHRKRL
jgi:hypothetical protein